jgi:hypothetical protein
MVCTIRYFDFSAAGAGFTLAIRFIFAANRSLSWVQGCSRW